MTIEDRSFSQLDRFRRRLKATRSKAAGKPGGTPVVKLVDHTLKSIDEQIVPAGPAGLVDQGTLKMSRGEIPE